MGYLIWNKKCLFSLLFWFLSKGNNWTGKDHFYSKYTQRVTPEDLMLLSADIQSISVGTCINSHLKRLGGSHTRGSLQVRRHDLAFERHLNPLSFPSTTYGYTLIINNGYLEGFLRQAKVNHLVSTALCPWGCSTNYICQWIKKISSNTWYRIKS